MDKPKNKRATKHWRRPSRQRSVADAGKAETQNPVDDVDAIQENLSTLNFGVAGDWHVGTEGPQTNQGFSDSNYHVPYHGPNQVPESNQFEMDLNNYVPTCTHDSWAHQPPMAIQHHSPGAHYLSGPFSQPYTGTQQFASAPPFSAQPLTTGYAQIYGAEPYNNLVTIRHGFPPGQGPPTSYGPPAMYGPASVRGPPVIAPPAMSLPPAMPAPSSLPNRPPVIDSTAENRGPFKAMDAVTGVRTGPVISLEERRARGFPDTYHGEIRVPRNGPANIRPVESTSLLIKNLPPGTTVKILEDALSIHAPFGKVFKASIGEGGPGHRYPTSLGRITMWDRNGAEAVYNFINSGNFVIQGHQCSVIWDRRLTGDIVNQRHNASRVLIIGGPKDIVNEDTLSRYLKTKVEYTTQSIETIYRGEDDNSMVWIFGSFQAQTTGAMRAIKTQWPKLAVSYGWDPISEGVVRAAAMNADGHGSG